MKVTGISSERQGGAPPEDVDYSSPQREAHTMARSRRNAITNRSLGPRVIIKTVRVQVVGFALRALSAKDEKSVVEVAETHRAARRRK
eukprot:657393-Rhodomonas_salina.5